MPLTNWYFDFHLTEKGWISRCPRQEGSTPDVPPSHRLLTIEMVEHNSDKARETYKVRATFIDPNKQHVVALFKKFGPPKGVSNNCPLEVEALLQSLSGEPA